MHDGLREALAVVAALVTFHTVGFLVIWLCGGVDPLEIKVPRAPRR